MLKFRTVSGATYLFDADGPRFLRYGPDEHLLIHKDDEWHDVVSFYGIEVGKCAMFVYACDGRLRVTTEITEVEGVND